MNSLRPALQCLGNVFSKLITYCYHYHNLSCIYNHGNSWYSPVCDMFIFVSSNMQATINPSSRSKACWYLRMVTSFPALTQSSLPCSQRTGILNFSSRSCITFKPFSYFSNAWHHWVSMDSVLSLMLKGIVSGVDTMYAEPLDLICSRSLICWNRKMQKIMYLRACSEVDEFLVILHLKSLDNGFFWQSFKVRTLFLTPSLKNLSIWQAQILHGLRKSGRARV